MAWDERTSELAFLAEDDASMSFEISLVRFDDEDARWWCRQLIAEERRWLEIADRFRSGSGEVFFGLWSIVGIVGVV